MKKIFALMLALCLLCGTAMAEVAAELTWDASLEESGSTQEINIGDAAKLLYWIPSQLSAIDPATIPTENTPIAAFGAENEGIVYTVSVYALEVESLEAYAAAQQAAGADVDNAKLVVANGIQVIGMENKTENFELAIAPVTDTQILVFAFTPCDGDEEWDVVKGYIVSSIRLAE